MADEIRYPGAMRCRTAAGIATSVVALFTTMLATAAGASPNTGRVVGHVRECNTPTNCVIQSFTVSARDIAGVIVARTTTTGMNRFALRVPAGGYVLTARSAGGLTCTASATAIAGETVHSAITCLVP